MRISTFGFFIAIVIAAGALSGCKALAVGTYSTCVAAADCSAASDTCVLVMSSSSDRMCSRACTTGSQCPDSRDGTQFGVCLPVASGDSFCYSHCAQDIDCPVGWMCNLGTVRGAACTPR